MCRYVERFRAASSGVERRRAALSGVERRRVASSGFGPCALSRPRIVSGTRCGARCLLAAASC
ncbi:MAG: hypothetical protein ABGY24_10340, partial [bacterium]